MVGYRRGALRTAVIAVSLLLVAACSGTDSSTVTIRSPEDVQVLTPKQVKEYKRRAAKGQPVAATTGASGAIPTNQDNRPVEERLSWVGLGDHSGLSLASAPAPVGGLRAAPL